MRPSSTAIQSAASVAKPPHGQPLWRQRALLLSALLVSILVFGGRALAQDAGDAAAESVEGATIVSSPWLLPFESLLVPEPVTWVIVLCSVVAVTLIIQASLRARRSVLLPDESDAQIEELIQGRNFRELIEFTDEDDSFVSRSLNPALKRAPSFTEMREALEAGVADETAEEFRKLEYINILANVGPLLGLLGTVVGIMAAFLEMQRAGGSAAVDQLAGGISTALGTTMLGLVLAIPSLVAYGILRNKVDRLTSEGALAAEEFLLMIRPDKDKAGGSSSSSKPRPRPTPAKAPARQSAPAPVNNAAE
ncbi:MAG: MotA/TolQ/ExbB proton channel family protein [Planctomycetota bacterium]